MVDVLAAIWFLLVGVCGCLYVFMDGKDNATEE
jgi:cytochrome bd-type quinol oxidase subunit 2